MKCIYTDKETDRILEELQRDKNFNLASFFRLAVRQLYNNNHSENKELILQKKIADYELSKAELELFKEELNKEKLVKLGEIAQKERDKEEDILHFSNYFKKQKEVKELKEKDINRLSREWAEIVIDQGASKAPLIPDFIKERLEK